MNKNQRIVIGLGLLLFILNGLFPPFEGKFNGSDSRRHLGYHLIFAPPTQMESFLHYDNGTRLEPCNSHVVTSLFLIQFGTIVGVTVGAFILFGRGNRMSEKK